MVLSDLVDVIGGGTPKTTEESYWNGSIPWLSVKDFCGDKKYVYNTEKSITVEGLNNSSTKLLHKDNIIISARGTVGELAMIPYDMVFNQSCFGLIPKGNNDPHFVYYLLKDKVRSLKSQTQGSVFDTITKATFDRIECADYSEEDQRRIASILSSLDRKIELNNKINADLEEMAQAIFKNWFVDFEPFKDGKFVDSELGMIPEGWKVGRADDFYQINIGKTPPRKENKWFSTNPADKIWVSIANMGNSGIFISDSSEYLTKEAVDRHNIIMVPRNTILLSFKLTVGRVAIADKELTTNEAIARFILSDDKYMEYLYLYLKNFDYNSLGSTSSIATAVNSKTIKGMQMLQPSDKIID